MSGAAIPGLPELERRLRVRRALAALALWFERLWPALWPPLGVLGAYACLGLLNVPRVLPAAAQTALLAGFAAAAAVAAWNGMRRVRRPEPGELDRRLEQASGLRHRPLAALADRPVPGDETGAALWRAHLARSAAQIVRLRVGMPHPGLAARDRRALRGGLVVALAATLGIAGGDALPRLRAAFTPTLPRGTQVAATELQAWVTPPAYTGMAPLFLKPSASDNAISVPAGSRMVVSVTGGSGGEPRIEFGAGAAPFRALDPGSFQADLILRSSGTLAVHRDGLLGRWKLNVVPDHPPQASWAAPPGPARARLHTALPWHVADDYGVTALSAEIRLRDRPDAPPLMVPIPLAGNGKDAHGVAEPDLSAHPWAGLPVTARLVARDGAGQEGRSDPAEFVLPERSFRNKEAQALIAIRKGLSLRPEDRESALAGLDALMVSPGSIGPDAAAFVNLSAIYYLLEFDQDPAAVPTAQNRLWELALRLEEGVAARTERDLVAAMKAAREAAEALRANPDQAHRSELEQKLQALREAIQQHMRALAEQYRKQGLPPPGQLDPKMRQLSQRDLDRMAQKALEAARQGQVQQAEQAIAQLERMLDALRQARPMTAEEAKRQAERRAQQQKGRDQLNAMQDLLNREGGILDSTQARTRDGTRSDLGSAQQGKDRAQEARVQQALRRALGEVMQQLGDMTGKVPGSLGEADQAMQSAAKALAQGQDNAAASAELKAIQALQKGGQEAGQQLADKFGQGQGQQDEGAGTGQDAPAYLTQGDPGAGPSDGTFGDQEDAQDGFGQPNPMARGRDPLGRRTTTGGHGYDEADDVEVPDKASPKRTEQIEEELRRRDADRTRPQIERDYIERLLRQF